jgi:hypothetical protein
LPFFCPSYAAIENIALNTDSGYAIARPTHLDATSAAEGWTCFAGTGLTSDTTHGFASSPSCIGNACRIGYAAIGYATLAYTASPVLGPSTFRTDSLTIATIPITAIATAAIATAAEEAAPRKLGFMFILPETLSP